MNRRFRRNRTAVLGLALVALFLAVSAVGPIFAPFGPLKQQLDVTLAPPGGPFLLGTDHLGRDILSRLLHASRISLLIGVGVVVISLISGTTIGIVAGFLGGWVDDLVMRLIDILLSFPGILLALAIASALGVGLWNVILAVGITLMPVYCRVVRGAVLRLRSMDFVLAATALGSGSTRIMFRHLLPNCMGPIVVQTSLRLADAILVASGLSFLGLGVPADIPEWGAMLADGRTYLRSASWIAVFPGLCLMAVVLGFNLLGDGLRDALDPRLKQ